jgi:hypothetical protein
MWESHCLQHMPSNTREVILPGSKSWCSLPRISIGHRERQNDTTIGWLLEPENPCVRFLTLTNLLGRSSREREASESRKAIPQWPGVTRILSKQRSDGGWDEGSSWYFPKYKSTVWQLIILSQTGIDPSCPAIKRMCEYSFRFQSASGAFVADRSKCESSDWASRAGCLNGNVIAALCRLGFGTDKRLAKAVDHLLSRQEQDGGWGCRSFGYHARDRHSCFMGSICALDALNEYGLRRHGNRLSEAIDSACEFLLMHRLFRADHHSFEPINSDWTRLRAPYLVSYDILRGLRALRMAGVDNDTRMKEALDIVIGKRSANGRWLRESRWPSRTYYRFGKIGQEDKWVTLVAMQVLEGVYAKHVSSRSDCS